MIKIIIEKNIKNEPIFKIALKGDYIEKYRFLKRALIESKDIKGRYNYMIPIRYLEPIVKNVDSTDLIIDKKSVASYLEFSDDYDEKYYYKVEADAKYMKKWREEGCPTIYKININSNEGTITKDIAFTRLKSIL